MNKGLLPTFNFLCMEYCDCANCPFDKNHQHWVECQEEFRNLPLEEQVDKINEMTKHCLDE